MNLKTCRLHYFLTSSALESGIVEIVIFDFIIPQFSRVLGIQSSRTPRQIFSYTIVGTIVFQLSSFGNAIRPSEMFAESSVKCYTLEEKLLERKY